VSLFLFFQPHILRKFEKDEPMRDAMRKVPQQYGETYSKKTTSIPDVSDPWDHYGYWRYNPIILLTLPC